MHSRGQLSEVRVAPEVQFSGPEAAHLAGITYRQLDYWARQEWVVPSGDAAYRSSRRAYAVPDVLRLAALGHLSRSHVDVATYGHATGRLRLPTRFSFVFVWAIHDGSVQVTRTRDLRRALCDPGHYVVYDPTPLLRTVRRRATDRAGSGPRRRSFSDEFKLATLAEYEGLTEPGAKGAFLQREGLYSSHLVGWRRMRDSGSLSPGGS